MPTPRALRSRQPSTAVPEVPLSAKTPLDAENLLPNTPHAVQESPTKEINFSRKRPLTAVKTGDDSAMGTPKRVRSTQQLNTDNVQTSSAVHTLKVQRKHASPSASLSRRHASDSGRNSRFKEASMHDRISDKPPSMFMRVFGGGAEHGAHNVDQLMEDYHDINDSPHPLSPATTQARTPRPVTRQTQLAGLTRHANTSISESSTAAAPTDSGIYRFGRSIASAFNPIRAWKTMQRSLKHTEEELVRENAQKAAEAEAAEQRAQIQAAYEELKRSGAIPTKTVPRPATSARMHPADTRPGTQLSSTRSSADMRTFFEQDGSTGTACAGERGRPASRKSVFHVQRPSLNDLKSLPSQANFAHTRAASTSRSPEKQTPHVGSYSQSSLSKKSLAKQQKLTKQVSNLEAKLEKARVELHTALSEAKPLPGLPTEPELTPVRAKTPSKPFSLTKMSRNSLALPALESIPSERFLLRTDAADQSDHGLRHRGEGALQLPMAEQGPAATDDLGPEMSEHSFLSDPSDDEAGAAAAYAHPRDSLMSDLAAAQMAMLNTPPPSTSDALANDTARLRTLHKPARQTRLTRKRKSGEEIDDDGRSPDEDAMHNTHPATTTASKRRIIASSDAVSQPHNPQDKPPSQNPLSTANAPTPQTSTEHSPNRPLSLIAEETASIMTVSTTATAKATTTAVRLNDEPEKSTAVKTPAAYHARAPARARGPRPRSASPDAETPRRSTRRRVLSPPPGDGCSKRARLEGEEVRVVPGGDGVPALPGAGTPSREPGSPFQWPEDCF